MTVGYDKLERGLESLMEFVVDVVPLLVMAVWVRVKAMRGGERDWEEERERE